MRPITIRTRRRGNHRLVRLVMTVALFALGLLSPSVASALPGPAVDSTSSVRHDLPGWISESSAASLAVGIDVLVPSDPPEPFSGEPSISASDGYYNLYWLISGSPPTFLSITGEAGGTIPDYSKYDRNVQLTVNASVNGYDAYHDLTPIYDLVYWQVGGVVYSVESRNMTGSDSLSLANSLESLIIPATEAPTDVPAPEPTVPVESGNDPASGNASDGSGNASDGNGSNSSSASGNASNGSTAPELDGNASNATSTDGGPSLSAPSTVEPGGAVLVTVSGSNGSTLQVDAGVFTATDRDSIINVADTDVQWEAPSPDSDETVTFQLVNGGNGDVLATAQTLVTNDANRALVCPASADSSKDQTLTLRGAGVLTLKTDMGTFPANGINADFSANGGGTTLSGTMPAAGEIKLDWNAPARKTDGVANITVTDENGDAVAACAIAVAKTAPKPTATPKPAKSVSTQKSDGTDLFVTGPGAVKPEPRVVSLKPAGAVDDGSGILAAVTPGPGATPTPAPTATAAAPKKTATPSVKPTATLAPTLDTSGMVSQVIGPDGGQLSCPTGATITIPAGALAQQATVTLRPVSNSKLPARTSVDLLPGTGFDITLAAMDGKAIDGLKKPARFSIALASDKWRSGTTLYSVSGFEMVPLNNVTLSGDSVSAPVQSQSRYVAGVPVQAANSAKRSMAKLVMAGAALVFVLSVSALAFKLWFGRKTTMTVGSRRLR